MMNRLSVLLVLLLLPLYSGVSQFEGIVESRNLTLDDEGNPQQFTITMWIKKDRIRVQSSSFGTTPASTMIYRSDRHIIWMLNDDDKTYFEILQEEPSQGVGPSPSPAEEKPVIRKTGRTKKMLGYPCEQVMVKRGEGETEIWGTRGLTDLVATTSKVLGQSQAEGEGWMDEINTLGLYPLSASTRIEGKIVESQETTRIEPKVLTADLFDLPATYHKQDMGTMEGHR